MYTPTDPFTTLEFQNPPHHIPELHEILRYPDLKATRLKKNLQIGAAPELGCFNANKYILYMPQ